MNFLSSFASSDDVSSAKPVGDLFTYFSICGNSLRVFPFGEKLFKANKSFCVFIYKLPNEGFQTNAGIHSKVYNLAASRRKAKGKLNLYFTIEKISC